MSAQEFSIDSSSNKSIPSLGAVSTPWAASRAGHNRARKALLHNHLGANRDCDMFPE